jgi:predicted helicase
MTALEKVLNNIRIQARSEREKGTYFENLIQSYFVTEAYYKDEYKEVLTYAEWARRNNRTAKDTGIDLVAITFDEQNHAIQCKLYDLEYKLQKPDIDSFFTASGKAYFSHRIIVSTTSNWSENALDALENQIPPVTKIDLHDLERSQIDWSRYLSEHKVTLRPKKTLLKHQVKALNSVVHGFETVDRGKLIMACGTGKTFTSLKIAEFMAGKGGKVLFLVPSLSLLSQTLTEWTQESEIPLHSFAVCSDSDVGKKKGEDETDDAIRLLTHELQYPATTNSQALAKELQVRHDSDHMSVVFSTYHSIDVVCLAQKNYQLPEFDLIVCDEAHRTTGAKFEGEDESSFIKVHDGDLLKSKKRLYMTATPRIYADVAKANAEKDNIALCSMDDVTLYGKELHVITFSEAVQLGLLVDYKVIILAIEESHVSRRIQGLLADENNQLKVDDAAKIVGCWKALAKYGVTQDIVDDPSPMRRAVAFCQVIEPTKKTKFHKVASKNIASMFQAVVEAYQEQEDIENVVRLRCEAQHVDGSMNASEKEVMLDWLKAEQSTNEYISSSLAANRISSEHSKYSNTNVNVIEEAAEKEIPNSTDTDPACRILSNVRCLSEGVDIPALDAVIFLTPRHSQVDVVQSVGRVMRKDPAGKKKRGYVILPVVIPAGVEPHEALNDNKTYAVVWQVLQALRSHDDRFDAMVNKLDLEMNRSILSKMEVISICDKVPLNKSNGSSDSSEKNGKKKVKNKDAGRSGFSIGTPHSPIQPEAHQSELQFEIGEIEKAIYARVVQKCGNRHHWEDWANDIAKIARTHIDRIKGILENPVHEIERQAFKSFVDELRDDLNNSITEDEIVEMLAQHMITKPVFDALFSGYSFASKNPISTAMQGVLDALTAHSFDKEMDTLDKFYESVRFRASGIENSAGKQKIVVELYDKFFRNAFPRMTERLGIVYTPVEVVDFIIHSVDHLLKTEFGISLGTKGVHIIDPFTGTGTFISRLIQSNLIAPEDLPYKFKNEIHANEIVLLAYYIAAINIEAAYHDILGGEYIPFKGICLTDTFQLYEKEDLISAILVDNSARRSRQKKLDIRVIVGNPPYSSADKDDNNSKNIDYLNLDDRISRTYVAQSKNAMGKSKIYDSYIRALRWASDRVGENGVVGFVCGSGFIEKPAMDGIRSSMSKDFSSIYLINLRGDIRKNILTKGSAREGENIFEEKSMTGIVIVLFIKKKSDSSHAKIFYYDIGNNLSAQEKKIILNQKITSGLFNFYSSSFNCISIDEHGDWLNHRDSSFLTHPLIGSKDKDNDKKVFELFSMGLKTNRDSWVCNYSKKTLQLQLSDMINIYNSEVDRLASDSVVDIDKIEDYVCRDKTKIKWTTDVLNDLKKRVKHTLIQNDCVVSLYRPFTKHWVYANKNWNWTRHLMPSIFPNDGHVENLCIYTSGVGARTGFSAIITNIVPDLQLIDNGQGFPLYIYKDNTENTLFRNSLAEGNKKVQCGIYSSSICYYQAFYKDEIITFEDIFYYVYGLLHSEDYRSCFADNLSKELPRIPCVKKPEDFWAFSKAGRDLAHWHIDYETVEPYKAKIESKRGNLTDEQFYRVEKMKYASKEDKTRLVYNSYITVSEIPLEAYEYVVNGKTALDWVVERQCVKTDKDSGIVNDANLWATETIGTPSYPLELFLRLITVSLETMNIVKKLPKLDI